MYEKNERQAMAFYLSGDFGTAVDLCQEVQKQMQHWSDLFKESEVIPVSALSGFNLIKVKNLIVDLLPENPPYYPKDELTDKHLRFFVAEIIRERTKSSLQ